MPMPGVGPVCAEKVAAENASRLLEDAMLQRHGLDPTKSISAVAYAMVRDDFVWADHLSGPPGALAPASRVAK
jgi:hypothetical protein